MRGFSFRESATPEISFREFPTPEAQFSRTTFIGSRVSVKNPSRQDTETWPCPSALMMVYLSDPEAKIRSLLARGLLTSR